jgi:MinD superfamily P-loop ATPase containing an inserted ferredoxin domain
MAKITISKNACKGCGLCTLACPKKILAISKTVSNDKGYFIVEMTDPEKCTGCAACAINCPDCVIEVER